MKRPERENFGMSKENETATRQPPTPPQAKMTVPAIRERKNGAKLKMVTAYDAPTARIADRAGADIILVGDTLTQVVLGYEDTLHATIDIMVHHTSAVARARPNALIVGDMPWLSY